MSSRDIFKNFPNLKIEKKENFDNKLIPEEYKKIYNLLSKTPIQINILSQKINIGLSELQAKLTMMELEDLVIKLPNNHWIKK